MIDKFNRSGKSYPFDNCTVEEIVKYLQTYKKYISASMIDPKKLKEDTIHDYQSILQKENNEPTTKPEMLIPPKQSASPFAPIQPIQTPNYSQQPESLPVIQSTPIYKVVTQVPQSIPIEPIETTIQPPTNEPLRAYPPTPEIKQTESIIVESTVPVKPEPVAQSVDVSSSPTFHIINYVDTHTVAVNPSKPVYFTAAICSSSLANRYKFHNIPYILMVVNSKYKIPIYLRKKETDYYEFHKKKGPFYASRIDIQLFDHYNERIQINHKPTELFHFLFETTTD
jgi:hypothetical protein